MKTIKPSQKPNRRQILTMGAVSGIAVSLGSTTNSSAQAQAATMPKIEIARLKDLTLGTEINFYFPDEDSPAVLLVLAEQVQDGIGPEQNIVAFSSLCTHKGCQVNYFEEHKMLICPCHWSSFDPAKKGRIIIGQASSGLPQITLAIENGSVHATGITGLIYGRQTNVI